MKKIKKFIILAMATIMLFGATMTVNAATKCVKCGSTFVTSIQHSRCYCYAPVYFYSCASCKSYWEICSAGHWR